METRLRTITRMISYRITAFVMTIFWTYLFTHDIGKSVGFSGALHILLSIDYYIHERFWLRIKWGRNE